MNLNSLRIPLVASCLLTVAGLGCSGVAGHPGPPAVEPRPDQVSNFEDLYRANCAGCHGDQGRHGAAISLANPVYLSLAGLSNIDRVSGAGVPGTLMPGFSKAAGGLLTDKQVLIIAQGVVSKWGNANALGGQTPPPYAASGPGNVQQGQQEFATYCGRCHGADGTGATGNQGGGHVQKGSLVEPAYLALISDQGLRSFIIAGQPEDGMPDWRSDVPGHPLTDGEVTDIVAWLASHRTATPGQPYQTHQ